MEYIKNKDKNDEIKKNFNIAIILDIFYIMKQKKKINDEEGFKKYIEDYYPKEDSL